MNNTYAGKDVSAELTSAFRKKGVLRLDQFLAGEDYLRFAQQLWNLKGTLTHRPDQYSYIALSSALAQQLFASSTFKTFLSSVVGKKITRIAHSTQIFGWKNYTLVHDDHAGTERLAFFFCIAGTWDTSWGGTVTYLTGNGEGQSLLFPPQGNCLCIVQQRKDMHSFIKYVNHRAGKERFIIIEGVFS